MFKIIQNLLGLLIIILIVPQTPTENVVLRKFLDSGFFTTYNQAKKSLTLLTWSLIFMFLLITFSLNFF
jgi:hypothetical protein